MDADPDKFGNGIGKSAALSLKIAHRGIGHAIHRGENQGWPER
jgi:hypothetical protein